MAFFRILLTAAIVLVAAFVFIVALGVFLSVRPPKIISSIAPSDLGLAYEDVFLETSDGLRLAAWFVPRAGAGLRGEPRKAVILLHGYPADKGDVLPQMAFLAEKYDLLLFDFRYFGESEGSYTTIGVKEIEDLRAAVYYLESRGVEKIGVWGFSMGAAVALAGADALPQIRAVAADSSYARLDLMAKEIYRLPLLDSFFGWATVRGAGYLLGIDARDASLLAAAERLTIPVFLIHSQNDAVIPFSHALMLAESLSGNLRAEFWLDVAGRHGELADDYEKRVSEFFGKNL